jgi:hypothetical protein
MNSEIPSIPSLPTMAISADARLHDVKQRNDGGQIDISHVTT